MPNSKQVQSTNTKTAADYDLEDRTLEYARQVRDFVKSLPRTISNIEYCKQLIRSSSSVGANYLEANEALSKKDFLMRLRIARKEAKETRYWLMLVDTGNADADTSRKVLLQEVHELRMILSAIITKSV